MNQKKLNNALKQLRDNPTSTSLNVQVGQAYLENKKIYKAREHFNEALKLDSKNVQAYIGLGRSYRERDVSLGYLLKAVAIDPSNVDALLLTGRAYRRFRDHKKAIDYLGKSLKIEPNNATAWIDLGICYFYDNDIRNAIQCMEKAVEIDPKMDHAFSNLCRYYGEIDENLKALQYGKKAIELNGENANSHFVISFVYSKLGDFKETISALEKTVSLVPRHKQAYYQLGNVYLATGEYSKAQASFENAIIVDPLLEQAHIGLAMVYMDKGQPEEALKEFRQASFKGIKPNQPSEQYALEVGKRNIANRRYLHIESLKHIGLYFKMLPQPEAKEYSVCLEGLFKVLVEKNIDMDGISDFKARNIIGRLYQLVINNREPLVEKREKLLKLKSYVAKNQSSRHAFLAMVALQWDEVERYIQNYLPVFPELKLGVLRTDNLIFHEKGIIHFELKNLGLLPAHNVNIKVQPSNEFGTIESSFALQKLSDSDVFPFALSVYTEGTFSVSLQLDYDEGESEIQTFRFQAFRKNPYFYGRPVKDAEMFFGREVLINSILARIKNVAKQDILIHGIRRIGKSSLLYQIKNRLQLPLIPIYFSLQQIGEVDSLTVLRQLMLEMTDAFCASLPPTKQDIADINVSANMLQFNNGAPFDMVSRAFRKDLETLFSYAADLAPGIRFIILLDEGDLLFLIGIEMQRFLRDLLQRYDQVVMVLAGSPKIIELSASNYDSPFYNNFAHENLTGVDLTEAKELISNPMEVIGIACSNTLSKDIYNFCGGITYYIQAICFHMLNEVYENNQTECSKETLAKAEKIIFSELKKSFAAIWLEFSDLEREFLRLLAQAGGTIPRNSPIVKEKGYLSPGLTEYEVLFIDKENISIRAGLVKKWIQDICDNEN